MKIFFNSSTPRSGSTLLQNLLGQNPDFYVTPTSGVLELLFGARINYTNSLEFKAQDQELMKKGFNGFCKKGLYGFYEGITDKKYVIDKSRGWGIHYNMLNEFEPNPKIVVMVRDLRNIIASMENIYRKNPDKHDSVINHSKMQGTTTFKRVTSWCNSQPVGLALERIYEIILQGIDKKVFFLKYEDLLQFPDQVMNLLYRYFEIDPFKHDFSNIPQITQEDDNIYGIYGNHTISNVLTKSDTDFHQILDEASVNYMLNNFKWYFNYFKYV